MPRFVSISVLNNQRFDKMYSAYVCFRSACLDINLCTNLWVLRLGDVTCDLWSSSFLDRLNIGGMASSGRLGRASSWVPRSWDAWAPSWARAWIRREPGTPPAGTWTRWVWWPAGCAVPSNTAGIEREVFRDNRLGLAGGAQEWCKIVVIARLRRWRLTICLIKFIYVSITNASNGAVEDVCSCVALLERLRRRRRGFAK